jgi:hypothetical protein
MNSKENKAYFDKWAEEHVLMNVTFGWGSKGMEELTMRNCTYNHALAVAQAAGYQEPRWYKPWTWFNWVVTVG